MMFFMIRLLTNEKDYEGAERLKYRNMLASSIRLVYKLHVFSFSMKMDNRCDDTS